ncbi:hypothetical protein LEP1GSC036_2681 [Leptospira weilii str. 2006001853]|uniref:Uncharacterized protein n=2 Tax=Leptospira weilii TaxID=28184 RepID=A0A828Z2M5_9LEPT|nr:hypothetical protein LEP1GSC036_2681 [Leptospira weilii str. 2006001853]EMJ62776.1 hypothetical protein LEP1GSC051_1844 [Leptospira sp. P2653]EMN45002.1 hypothetical protein LEP1GSC086_2734 [Leptospira weilii str. LNT 1234]EMN91932.1 hypothetical protein LEP1GSC108_0587 [Leptospira weilii str. UI 13098]
MGFSQILFLFLEFYRDLPNVQTSLPTTPVFLSRRKNFLRQYGS